jgi:hypothetical protein
LRRFAGGVRFEPVASEQKFEAAWNPNETSPSLVPARLANYGQHGTPFQTALYKFFTLKDIKCFKKSMAVGEVSEVSEVSRVRPYFSHADPEKMA